MKNDYYIYAVKRFLSKCTAIEQMHRNLSKYNPRFNRGFYSVYLYCIPKACGDGGGWCQKFID